MTVLGYSEVPERLASRTDRPQRTGGLPDWEKDWDAADLDALLVDPVVSRAMPERFGSGDRLSFEVLVRPVRRASAGVRETRGDATRRGGERDAFLSALDIAAEADAPNRESVYSSWLQERFADAARWRVTRRWTAFDGRAYGGRPMIEAARGSSRDPKR